MGEDGDPASPHAQRFRLVGCEAGACLPLEVPAPADGAPGAVELMIEYAGAPTISQAVLLIGSSDPLTPERRVVLAGR